MVVLKDNSNYFKIILIALICSLAISVVVSFLFYFKLKEKPSKNDLIAEFYAVENAVHVSPHSIRKAIAKGDKTFVLVDLRSSQEYENEHIIGAINIPAYSDPDTSAYDQVDRIVGDFKKLPKDKNIIVYCYSMPCMTGRKIGQMLVENGIYVQHLGIGWNEWRYFWNLWNHEHEWAKTNVEDYIGKGKEPGVFKSTSAPDLSPCTLDNQFGC